MVRLADRATLRPGHDGRTAPLVRVRAESALAGRRGTKKRYRACWGGSLIAAAGEHRVRHTAPTGPARSVIYSLRTAMSALPNTAQTKHDIPIAARLWGETPIDRRGVTGQV